MPNEEESKICIYLGENKRWRVTADSFQFILSQKYKTKQGQYAYRVEGYYTKMGHLLEVLAMKTLRDTEIKTLKGIEKQLKILQTEIDKYNKVILK